MVAGHLTGNARTQYVGRMFGRIASRYDLLNDVLSLRQAQRWRRLAADLAALPANGLALDVASGTGDLALQLARTSGGRVIASDVCGEMLGIAQHKAALDGLAGQITCALADAHALPYASGTFACATVAFGVRNFAQPLEALAEMRRVVQPGGRVVCLEFPRPVIGPMASAYLWSLRQVAPALGRWVAGDEEPYEYLAESVRTFLTARQLQQLMEDAGLRQVRYQTMNCGTVAIHVGIA